MYHSLIFWDGSNFYSKSDVNKLNDPDLVYLPKGTHTWHDWHLIPSEKPSIAEPQFETNNSEYVGRSGTIDMTDKIYAGTIAYSDRVGNLQFYIDHEKEDWTAVRKKIVSALHGKKVKMVLEDDPTYYFTGRFTLTDIVPGASYSKLVLAYQLDPLRYPIIRDASIGNMYWDPFNFETDYDYSVQAWNPQTGKYDGYYNESGTHIATEGVL